MKILGVSSSLRSGSNSKYLLDVIMKHLGTTHDTQLLLLEKYRRDMGCTGCFYCQANKGTCSNIINNKLNDYLKNNDILILASPIYYGSISGVLKTFMEITYPLKPKDLSGKKVIFIGTAVQEGQEAIALSTILPWCVKHGMQLVHYSIFKVVECDGFIALENEEEKLFDFASQIEKVMHQEFSFELEFCEIEILDKKMGMPKSYRLIPRG